MKKEDYDFILEISNSEFPLIAFVNDLQRLKLMGKLQNFEYETMQEDLVKIAKLFKYYYDECQKANER